jgi:hypothetical protein
VKISKNDALIGLITSHKNDREEEITVKHEEIFMQPLLKSKLR